MSPKKQPPDKRGSLWRRWDPHVHLPGTLNNNQFGSMTVAEALNALARCDPAIEAIGVTDYCTTRSFKRAQEACHQGAGTSIKLLFPNVELRLASGTRKSAINIHLLCAPEHVDELDRFLGGLSIEHSRKKYRCEHKDLVLLGRTLRNDPDLDEEAALREAAEQFKLEFGELTSAYDSDSWAKEKLLIAVASGSTDGTSGLRTDDGGYRTLRQEIEHFSHIVLSSHPAEIRFWLGKGHDSPQELERKYGGKKPCIHGSDAHRPERLGCPDEDRFCWLKGDPIFDTLRLACLSPETRVHIGSTDPLEGNTRGRISAVRVPDTSWFPADGVQINPGLVAIIGARGKGKTALADVIAAGAGMRGEFDPQSFLHRAGILLGGALSEVSWGPDETTRRALYRSEQPALAQTRSVRYLSQQFVDRLCASDGVSTSLLGEIERVVYASIPIDERHGATSFQELLDIRLQTSRSSQKDELGYIASVSEDITTERALTRSVDSLGARLAAQQEALAELDQAAGELTKQAKRGDTERHDEVSRAKEQVETNLQRAERRHTELQGLQERVASIVSTTFDRTFGELRSSYQRAGLTEEQWESFRPRFGGPVDNILTSALAGSAKEVRDLRGSKADVRPNLDGLDATALAALPLSALKTEQERIQGLIGLDKDRTESLNKLTTQATQTRAFIERLEEQLANAKGADARRANLVDARLTHYAAYFDALLQEEAELQRLYAPLSELLGREKTTAKKLELTVQRKVDVEAWAGEGQDYLDLRGSVFKTGTLKETAEAELLSAWQGGDGATAAAAIKAFSSAHSDQFRAQMKADPQDPDEVRTWERGLNRWLYSAEHIKLSYSLKSDETPIDRLSPGSRGIVLLLLYLAVDVSESDPLIIDQPEENLDPESVYHELVRLFRDASRRRQIIMVTHNANLVVNTDVDQVIVARSKNFEEGKLPEMEYTSGGLEIAEIRHLVCEVLEGGDEAFKQRARRLGVTL